MTMLHKISYYNKKTPGCGKKDDDDHKKTYGKGHDDNKKGHDDNKKSVYGKGHDDNKKGHDDNKKSYSGYF